MWVQHHVIQCLVLGALCCTRNGCEVMTSWWQAENVNVFLFIIWTNKISVLSNSHTSVLEYITITDWLAVTKFKNTRRWALRWSSVSCSFKLFDKHWVLWKCHTWQLELQTSQWRKEGMVRACYKNTRSAHTHTYKCTCLLLILMLCHRKAIFESKGDKLSSSAECR